MNASKHSYSKKFAQPARLALTAAALLAVCFALAGKSFSAPEKKIPLPPSKQYQAYADKAMAAFDKKEYASALSLFDKAVELNGNYTEGILYGGISLFYLNRCAEAVKRFDRTLQVSKSKEEKDAARDWKNECAGNPGKNIGAGTIDPLADPFGKGRELYERNKFKEAVPYFEKVLKEEESNARAMLYLGECYCKTGQLEKGREQLGNVSSHSRKNFELERAEKLLASCETAEGALASGVKYFDDKEYEKAIPPLERALEDDKTSMEARLYLGRSYCMTGKAKEGADQLETVVDQSEDAADAEQADKWLKDCEDVADKQNDSAGTTQIAAENVCLGATVKDNWSDAAASYRWTQGWHEGSDMKALTDGDFATAITSGYGGWGESGDGQTFDVQNALGVASGNGEGVPCASLDLGRIRDVGKITVGRPAQNDETETGMGMTVSLWASIDGEKWTKVVDGFVLPPGGQPSFTSDAFKSSARGIRYIRVNMHSLGLYKWNKKTNSQMGISEIQCFQPAAEKEISVE